MCKNAESFIDSHHDVIVSQCNIRSDTTFSASEPIIIAPKLANERHRIIWSDDGIKNYQSLLIPNLERLQQLWLTSNTRSCASMFIGSTNNILAACATATNRSFSLSASTKPMSTRTP